MPKETGHLHRERLVAAALDAERRSPEPAVSERASASGNAIERSAHLGWHEQPWTRGIVVIEPERCRLPAPHDLDRATTDRAAHLFGR